MEPSSANAPLYYYSLSGAVVIAVEGKDAERYLHNRLTIDVKRLTPGAHVRGAALTPQGKIEALFRIVRISGEQFLLVADGGEPELVRKALARFAVADRVTFLDVSAQWALHHLYSENLPPALSTERAFSTRRSAHKGIDLLAPGQRNEEVLTALTQLQALRYSDAQARYLRYEACIPSFPEELNNILLPESGIDEIISFTKGCYAGQEVVEKIAARGKVPRLLTFLAPHGPLTPSSVPNLATAVHLTGETTPCGELRGVAVAPDQSTWIACCSLRNVEHVLRGELNIGATPVHVVRAKNTHDEATP